MRKERMWQIQAATCELRTHVIRIFTRKAILCSWNHIQNCITTIPREDNIAIFAQQLQYQTTMQLFYIHLSCVWWVHTTYIIYIAYQEQCFQECSCKESIDVAWISWKSLTSICIVSYPLYGDPHLNQEISKETQHYHCDDEGLESCQGQYILYWNYQAQSIHSCWPALFQSYCFVWCFITESIFYHSILEFMRHHLALLIIF